MGSPHGSSVVSRVVTQISIPPSPPDRVEVKKSDRPSPETLGFKSREELLIFSTSVGVPKVKSAFATIHNAKTNAIEILFIILLPFQSFSPLRQGVVNIPAHTMCGFVRRISFSEHSIVRSDRLYI
jgi:hypothetical protein